MRRNWSASESDSPGNEQRDFWGSDAAGREGSMNLIGIKDPAIDKLVDDFYDRMETLPEARELRAIHAPDLAPIRRILKLYLNEWLGGPKGFSTERGHPMLRARHLPFSIGIAERDQWMLCMNGALDAMPCEPEVREHLRTGSGPPVRHRLRIPGRP